jgi:hypothetical protein
VSFQAFASGSLVKIKADMIATKQINVNICELDATPESEEFYSIYTSIYVQINLKFTIISGRCFFSFSLTQLSTVYSIQFLFNLATCLGKLFCHHQSKLDNKW